MTILHSSLVRILFVGGLAAVMLRAESSWSVWDPTSPLESAASVEAGLGMVRDLDAGLTWYPSTNGYRDDLLMEWDPGFALFGGFRERVQPWLAAEIQGGLLYSGLDQSSTASGMAMPFSADLWQVPVMFNLVLQWPGEHRFTPFAGGGVGANISWLDLDLRLPDGEGGSLSVEETSTEVSFAWQVFAGLRIRMGGSSEFSAAYHLVNGGTPDFALYEFSTVTSGSGTNAVTRTVKSNVGTLSTDDIVTQAVTVGFHVGF